MGSGAGSKERLASLIAAMFEPGEVAVVLSALELAVSRPAGIANRTAKVVELMLGQHADHVVISALLLVPLVRAGDFDRNTIEERFDEVTAKLVDDVTSQDALRTDTATHQEEDLHALLDSMTRDIRSAVLQLGVRLEELEFRRDRAEARHVNLARETLELYVPLAGRLGLGAIRSRLEDVCFSILQPDAYRELKRTFVPIREEDAACLVLLIDGVRKLLERNQIGAEVHGRTKGLFSLHRKMEREQLSLEAITDKIGMRIIVSSVPECYAVLGLLHTHFKPIPGRFKDYIGLPKANGYQSLHTTVYPVREISHKPVELQIRTRAMHAEAEFGAAAHWLYKTEGAAQAEDDRQLAWLQGLPAEREESASHQDFVERLRELVYGDHIVVFDRAGIRTRLPAGSRIEDLCRAIGEGQPAWTRVVINGQAARLDTVLRDGDTVAFED